MQDNKLMLIALKAHKLIKSDNAREVNEDYLRDIALGLISYERYIGFLDGLCAGDQIEYEDYCDLTAEINEQ